MFHRLLKVVIPGGLVVGEAMMRSGQKVMFRKVSACVLALAVVCGGAVPASAAVRVSDADRKKYQSLTDRCGDEFEHVRKTMLSHEEDIAYINRGYLIDLDPKNPSSEKISMWGGSDFYQAGLKILRQVATLLHLSHPLVETTELYEGTPMTEYRPVEGTNNYATMEDAKKNFRSWSIQKKWSYINNPLTWWQLKTGVPYRIYSMVYRERSPQSLAKMIEKYKRAFICFGSFSHTSVQPIAGPNNQWQVSADIRGKGGAPFVLRVFSQGSKDPHAKNTVNLSLVSPYLADKNNESQHRSQYLPHTL